MNGTPNTPSNDNHIESEVKKMLQTCSDKDINDFLQMKNHEHITATIKYLSISNNLPEEQIKETVFRILLEQYKDDNYKIKHLFNKTSGNSSKITAEITAQYLQNEYEKKGQDEVIRILQMTSFYINDILLKNGIIEQYFDNKNEYLEYTKYYQKKRNISNEENQETN